MTGPIYRLSTAGERTQVTKLAMPQVSHSFPRFLPDGIHFLYFVTGGPDVRGVYSVDSMEVANGVWLMRIPSELQRPRDTCSSCEAARVRAIVRSCAS
jgi:hypothetical protein